MANKQNKSVSMAKRFPVYIYIELAASIIFSLLSISFHGDISLVSFPIALIFTAVTVYFAFFKMLRKKDGKQYFTVLKLTQYLPFALLLAFILRRAGNYGTPYWYDVISVLVWCIVFIFSLVISYCLNDKRLKTVTENWEIPAEKKKKPRGAARLVFEIVDWLDALIQAVFMVLLIQIFILQLYVIPSESMVPTFLIKDRVAVTKLNCGPKFPLTDVGLNDFTKYKRGDIVVVRNPHYSMDRKSEVKTVTSQLVYMLTFMAVNLNKDENGQPKADPLVKRITGISGEQLVMQDGVLYSRTNKSDIFQPVKEDEKYACWNLNAVTPGVKKDIQTFPFNQKEYEIMLDFEDERRNFDLNSASAEARLISKSFKNLCYTDNLVGSFEQPSLNEYSLLSNVQSLTRQLMNTTDGAVWFENFMTSWINTKDNSRDIYAEANYRLNVMTKMTFGSLVLRYASLIRGGISASEWSGDEIINKHLQTAQKLDWYIRGLLDSRNMPVFPANDENGNPRYIPENCYFMMGDNRFNSLDMRHAYEYVVTPLTKDDNQSVVYNSIMEPQYVNQRLIIGKPNFRFWPVTRRGKVN